MARRTAIVCAFSLLAYTSTAIEQVEQQWIGRFGGSGDSGDAASSMAVDAAGNVYVTGSVGQSNGPWDYATVKYDARGHEQWIARYSGPGGSFDAARRVVVDRHGNVYVTGESVGTGTSFDYATLKYDATGAALWVARYDGPAHGADFARDLAVDDAGNVYVTGGSAGETGASDYLTIKYDAYGNELWTARYSGAGGSGDDASALAIDAAGHVYVTGRSGGTNPEDFDYATIKYGSDGRERWIARHSGPADSFDSAVGIALDRARNVYVTGTENGDYGTVKYDPDGNALWVARYDGPVHSSDQPRALALDAAGNVVVTGMSLGEAGEFDYATVTYDTNGAARWVARYNGPGNGGDMAFAMALDESRSVYVTGASMGAGTGLDYATVKYDANGNEAWVARHDGPANSADSAVGIAVDPVRRVYVTGSSFSPDTHNDYATITYAQPLPPEATLTVRKTGMGGVSIISNPRGIDCGRDCTQTYVRRTLVTLSASAAFGTVFLGWEGCDGVNGMTCTVLMRADRSVTARFLGVLAPPPHFSR